MPRSRTSVCLLFLLCVLPSFAKTRSVHHSAFGPVKRIFVVVLENTTYEEAVAQPFMKRLISEGALLRNYHGVAHPSLPNYIAMAAGSAYGVDDDAPVTLDERSLADLLEARGLTWKVYAENYPGGCYLGSSADHELYVRRHVPFLMFKDIVTNATRCGRIVNATTFDADIAANRLPTFAYYIPNNHDNGHDTNAATADLFLQNRFATLLKDSRFTAGTLFVVTFDESELDSPSNHIATIVWGAGVHKGATSDRRYSHYNLLRTIEDLLGTPTLGKSDSTSALIDDVISR